MTTPNSVDAFRTACAEYFGLKAAGNGETARALELRQVMVDNAPPEAQADLQELAEETMLDLITLHNLVSARQLSRPEELPSLNKVIARAREEMGLPPEDPAAPAGPPSPIPQLIVALEWALGRIRTANLDEGKMFAMAEEVLEDAKGGAS